MILSTDAMIYLTDQKQEHQIFGHMAAEQIIRIFPNIDNFRNQNIQKASNEIGNVISTVKDWLSGKEDFCLGESVANE